MKNVICTLWIISVSLVGFVVFGAQKQKRYNPKAKSQPTRRMEQIKSVEPVDVSESIFGMKPVNNEDLWKLFAAGAVESFNEPVNTAEPLVKVTPEVTPGWRARLTNMKDAMLSRARRLYNYLFSKKSTISTHTLRFDEATGKYVTEVKTVEI